MVYFYAVFVIPLVINNISFKENLIWIWYIDYHVELNLLRFSLMAQLSEKELFGE